jgi:hypothetical protein
MKSFFEPIPRDLLMTWLPYLMGGYMLYVLRFFELSMVRIGGILPASVIKVLFLILGHIIVVRVIVMFFRLFQGR